MIGPVVSSESKPAEAAAISIHDFAMRGDLTQVEKLLTSGVDINEKDESGMTALHFAADSGSVEMVNLLLLHNADPHAEDEDGDKPIDHAKHGEWNDVIDLLEKVM